MTDPRAEALAVRLEKGRQKTFEIFNALTPDQWKLVLYREPEWQVRALLAHFVSSESQLRLLTQDVAGGGQGAPPDLDLDRYNADGQRRLEGCSVPELLEMLEKERQKTIAWIRTLDAGQLDRIGRHPALGQVNVEAMITAIYGHQLLHMRDLSRLAASIV
jgi:hypothetical protein